MRLLFIPTLTPKHTQMTMKRNTLITISGVSLLSIFILQAINNEYGNHEPPFQGSSEVSPLAMKQASKHSNPSDSNTNAASNQPSQLWQAANSVPAHKQSLDAEVAVEYIQSSPELFKQLHVGERVALYIPQENRDYIGTVNESYEQFQGKIKVSSGPIENSSEFSSFTVTKGDETTLVMVATDEGIFQVEIDNETGNGTVIDDRSLDFYRKHDDSLSPPPEGIS